jgi:hypothetical protein
MCLPCCFSLQEIPVHYWPSLCSTTEYCSHYLQSQSSLHDRKNHNRLPGHCARTRYRQVCQRAGPKPLLCYQRLCLIGIDLRGENQVREQNPHEHRSAELFVWIWCQRALFFCHGTLKQEWSNQERIELYRLLLYDLCISRPLSLTRNPRRKQLCRRHKKRQAEHLLKTQRFWPNSNGHWKRIEICGHWRSKLWLFYHH